MSTATKEALSTKNSQLALRNKRIVIYRKNVRARGLFKGVNGETFHVPESLVARQSNFKEFVKVNFEYDFSKPNVWPDNVVNLPVYKKLKHYSETAYGAAMIYRVLQDNKKAIIQKRELFKVRYDDGATGQTPQAGLNFILLTRDFPNKSPYKGGEKKYDLAIIRHEFGHTRFFRKKCNTKKMNITLEDERQAVINLENPIRLQKGLEPRYTYFRLKGVGRDKGTINIITGEKALISENRNTILLDDPTKLVKIGSKGAYK